MVGHSGDIAAAIRAVEAVDACLGRLAEAVRKAGGALLITADHGNAECMHDPESNQPHTAHTVNRVPVVLVNAAASMRKHATPAGRHRSDAGATACPAAEMTGRSLIRPAPPRRRREAGGVRRPDARLWPASPPPRFALVTSFAAAEPGPSRDDDPLQHVEDAIAAEEQRLQSLTSQSQDLGAEMDRLQLQLVDYAAQVQQREAKLAELDQQVILLETTRAASWRAWKISAPISARWWPCCNGCRCSPGRP
jgi:hypothetical protein